MLCDIGGHVMDVRTVCAQLFEAVSVVFLLVGVLIAPSMAAESEEEYRENLTHITNEIKEANELGLIDGLGDLRQLGRGFLTLSQLEIGGGRSEASPSQADRSESDGGRPKSPAQPVETPALSRASGAASVPAGPESAPPITGAGAEPDRQESVTAAPRGDQTERPSAGVATDGEAHADAVATRVGPPAYSALDEGVSPPVEILRRMPRWSPGGRITQTRTTLTGLLEILIDERGTVESASIVRSVTPTYDEVLVQAALGWRFGPAKKAGQAVRYRQVLEIVLRPTRVD